MDLDTPRTRPRGHVILQMPLHHIHPADVGGVGRFALHLVDLQETTKRHVCLLEVTRDGRPRPPAGPGETCPAWQCENGARVPQRIPAISCRRGYTEPPVAHRI